MYKITENDVDEFKYLIAAISYPSVSAVTDMIELSFFAGVVAGFHSAKMVQDQETNLNGAAYLTTKAYSEVLNNLNYYLDEVLKEETDV